MKRIINLDNYKVLQSNEGVLTLDGKQLPYEEYKDTVFVSKGSAANYSGLLQSIDSVYQSVFPKK